MLTLKDMDEISVDPTTDTSIPAYSHSMLNTIATCPTLGLVTYVSNKVMKAGGRALALEAGSASHEAYAAARLWQVGEVQGLREHMDFHGARLFGEDNYEAMWFSAKEAGDDDNLARLRFCLEAFYNYGYFDDPSDKRRTFTNIEEALIAFLHRFDWRRDVWVQDKDNPEALIGVEIPVDITITYKNKHEWDNGPHTITVRFIGTADGISVDKNGLRLEENKTASRLGEAWTMSWHTNHQPTGYMLALNTMFGLNIERAAIHGMCIPLPRSYDAGGLVTETVTRTSSQFYDFLGWVLHQVQLIDKYKDDPLSAPKNTGACNKYFRPCSLIPLCASDMAAREEYFEMMDERDPSPTEKAMSD